ncbi:hypothetical protein COB64_02010 [Candidatus Wolfebacteria bacterium]|nr:MAG: hypothetical protein COB64_02010 [Candidatus Wolfebacteria bacterium]
MPKKTIIIIISIIVGLAIIFSIAALIQGRSQRQAQEIKMRDFLPFGSREEKEDFIDVTQPEEEIIDVTEIEIPTTAPIISKLTKISSFAVAGATTITKERVLEKEEEIEQPIDVSSFKTMRLGSTGEEIQSIQTILNRQDPSPNLELSGEYDESTRAAVIAFQKNNNLVADGIAGKNTFAALNAFQGINGPQIETVAAVRYVKKSSGHIYETFLDDISERKISNTTIPKIQEVVFGNNGDSIVLRYISSNRSTIESFSGILEEETQSDRVRELDGIFLPQNVSTISASPDSSSFFYMNTIGPNTIGLTSTFENKNKKQIFISEFSEWISQWANDRMITLTTKASGLVHGFAYRLDPDTESFDKLLGDIAGLTTLTSPNGKLILYSESLDNSIQTYLYNTDTRQSTRFSVATLPEKCTWSSSSITVFCSVPTSIGSAVYPDSWYQGAISFSDALWEINVLTDRATILATPLVDAGEDIDGTNLSLSHDNNYLTFINKNDSYLWSLTLN